MASVPATFTDESGVTRFAGTLTTGVSTGNFQVATITTDSVTAITAATTGLNVGGASDKLGFYGNAPTLQQTGVAVTAGGIHAALVALGLITA